MSTITTSPRLRAHTALGHLTALALSGTLCCGLLFGGEAQADLRSRVERSLSVIEKGASKAALLRVYGADVERVLREIVAKPSRAVLARVRALTALRYFPSKATRELLAAEIGKTKRKRRGLELIYLQQALRSYAVVTGKAAITTLAPLLTHSNIDVRVAAGEALRLSGSPKARALIAARAKRDTSATVRAELTGQLQLIDRAADKARK
jgi:hypothetical protein